MGDQVDLQIAGRLIRGFRARSRRSICRGLICTSCASSVGVMRACHGSHVGSAVVSRCAYK